MGIELAFIIPLKSAKVSSDWERTQEMLRNTLASVNQQPGCRAIVVCNEPPDVDATIVEANFQVQSLTFEEARNDKMRKCHLGLQHAASFSPKRAMLLDADDLVHREFVKHVSRFDPSFGVKYIQFSHPLIKPDVTVDIDHGSSRFSFLGRYDHYTVGTPGSINRRGGRILQYFDRFNVIGVDIT